MSLTRCVECDEIFDTDEFPEGYYDAHGNARDGYLCEWCDTEDKEDDGL